jgi:DNA helicase HerA-like ATPase
MVRLGVKPDIEEIVGATYGESSPQISEAVLISDKVGLGDFLKIGDTLTQVQEITIKSSISEHDAIDIANGKSIDTQHKVLTKLDIIGEINGTERDRLIPIMPGSKLSLATSKQIAKFLGFEMTPEKIKIGHLQRRPDIPVVIEKEHFYRHISILGKTGSGKSNLSKVILKAMQETLSTPIIIVDPHGEYQGDIIEIESTVINNYDNLTTKSEVINEMNKSLKATERKLWDDIVLTARCSSTIAKKKLTEIDGLIEACSDYYLRGAGIYREKILSTVKALCSMKVIRQRIEAHFGSVPLVINLSGTGYREAEMIVKNVAEIVLELGKAGKPIITFIDEIQLFCPQKRKNVSKDAIINLVKEGRKFNCGVVIASQRPADVDKGIISQCGTNFILKLSNENDIRQVKNSTENSSKQMFQEVQKLQPGEALLTSPWVKRAVFIKIDMAV